MPIGLSIEHFRVSTSNTWKYYKILFSDLLHPADSLDVRLKIIDCTQTLWICLTIIKCLCTVLLANWICPNTILVLRLLKWAQKTPDGHGHKNRTEMNISAIIMGVGFMSSSMTIPIS